MDMDKNEEISLRQHVESIGWGERYLDKTGHFAREGLKSWSSCLEPFNFLQRLLTRKRLPILQIIPLGTRINFLKSLKYDIVGSDPRFSFFGIFVRIMSFVTGIA